MWNYNYNNELCHFGVKGMKWGHRKARPKSELRNRYDSAKVERTAALKKRNIARSEFNRAYNHARNRAAGGISPFKKHRQANDIRWENAENKLQAYKKAQSDYKQARSNFKNVKKERVQAHKNTRKELLKQMTVTDKMLFGRGHIDKATNYVVDNNMPVDKAVKKVKKEAIAFTAAALAIHGAIIYKNVR